MFQTPSPPTTIKMKLHSPHPARGRIQLILGPMFSGKTTELMRRCKRYQIANYTCSVVKYARDLRYSKTALASHDQQTLNASFKAVSLKDILPELREMEVVGIDEGQFFPDIVEVAEELADLGKIVIISALDGTFARQGFPNIMELVPLSEEVMKLNAVCMVCFKEASFTKRKTAESEVEVIGGTDKYLAVCRACHKLDLSPKKDEPKPMRAVENMPIPLKLAD